MATRHAAVFTPGAIDRRGRRRQVRLRRASNVRCAAALSGVDGRTRVLVCLAPLQIPTFYIFSITSILEYIHEAVNVYKKITNCTV
jgi:hypothetical protein